MIWRSPVVWLLFHLPTIMALQAVLSVHTITGDTTRSTMDIRQVVLHVQLIICTMTVWVDFHSIRVHSCLLATALQQVSTSSTLVVMHGMNLLQMVQLQAKSLIVAWMKLQDISTSDRILLHGWFWMQVSVWTIIQWAVVSGFLRVVSPSSFLTVLHFVQQLARDSEMLLYANFICTSQLTKISSHSAWWTMNSLTVSICSTIA